MIELWFMSLGYLSFINQLQVRLWACGRGDVSTPSFGSHLNPISSKGVRLCPPYTGVHTKFWKPQARLKHLTFESTCKVWKADNFAFYFMEIYSKFWQVTQFSQFVVYVSIFHVKILGLCIWYNWEEIEAFPFSTYNTYFFLHYSKLILLSSTQSCSH